MADHLITPRNRTSKVWQYFGFPKGQREGKKAYCKICKTGVVHAGGTTNLKTHLYTWHRLIHDELYQESATVVEGTSSSTLDDFVKRVTPLPQSSEKAKKLTRAICEMIARDIRPISIVNDIGFLNLLREAEPRYSVPCRTTITRNLNDLYTSEKRRIRGVVASAEFVSCTTDMWSSRNGDGYISLTCHFITSDFKMCFHNLQTHHFPGTHDHATISQALTTAANDWCINFDKQLVAFTTDSGSNVVKALDSMNVLRLACAGHTLNLAVQKALQIPQVSTPLARCRKLVSHFHKSRVDSDEFKKNQLMFSDVPKHKLIHDVITRWNSTYDMIERVCEQQLPISSVLLQHRDSLMHLELLPSEWRVLEDILKLLRPFKIATAHLSGEKYPTISALGPLLHEIQCKTVIQDDDVSAIKAFKKTLQEDMNSRYVDPNIKFLMYKSSFLDPRFKTLTHLSATVREEIFDCVLEDILQLNEFVQNDCELLIESASTTEVSVTPPLANPGPSTATDEPTKKKKRKSALMELIGSKFQSNNEQSTDTITFKDIVQSELLRYKTEPSISVDQPPLHWWSAHQHLYPNVSKLARKYLCVVATSVPSEQLFSTAGNVISVKRTALLPENVEKLIFLHDNLPPLSLPYKRCNQEENCDCDSCN